MSALTKEYTFDSVANLSFDSDKVQISGGAASLKLLNNPGQDFIQNFDNDTGFTYDSDFAEFVGGVLRQKDTRPTNAVLYASFNSDEDANWTSIGTGTGTLSDGATVSGGKLDLTGYVADRRLSISASDTSHDSQKGCMRCKFTPNYSGDPTQYQYIMQWRNGGLENNIQVLQNTGGFIQAWIRDGTGGNILSTTSFGTYSFTSGQTYEIEFNWDCDLGEHRLFIDGTQVGTTKGGTGTRDLRVDQFDFGVYYNNVGQPNFYIDEFIYFDAVQHTSNYTPDWSDIYEYIYEGSNVICPEMEYTGAGTLVSFDSFLTTESGSPRYTIQIGRSGNYLYWNGSAWVVSDGTYAQANDATTFNSNAGSLDVLSEIYGQFKIHFDDSNTTQMDVDTLTASLTAQIYSTDNPSVEITELVGVEEILTFVETASKSGNDEIKYALFHGGGWVYWNGSAWVTSDQTYSQSNTVSEISTNISSLSGKTNFKLQFRLHSDDGTTTPSLQTLVYTYDFYGGSSTAPNICIVYGWMYDESGEPLQGADIAAIPSIPVTEYEGNVLMLGAVSTQSGSDGYWELDLIETESISVHWVFYFSYSGRKREYYREVPNEANKLFKDLEVA